MCATADTDDGAGAVVEYLDYNCPVCREVAPGSEVCAGNVPNSDWVCRNCALMCLGTGAGKRCKWLIDKPLEPPAAD
jgi:hypothetical protein